MEPIDSRIIKFAKQQHLLTVATSADGVPYVASCFYAYDVKRNLFIFTSSQSTRHGREMLQNQRVALNIALHTRIVGRIKGLQVTGHATQADEAAKSTYLKCFPYAVVAPLELWMVAPDMLKLTDNTLGFGKKLIWQNME
ncbi:MAG: pyridoxamine 5'-phosphate oxidase family protein [Alistipes sp.]|jgi:uncharacterized protein YhbP (UPF0306 family)|nr:pyridoxamine 5'-phosphate oxidase family protein [Alistipes sp.]